MASVSEEKTKGLTADKLMNIEGYPTAQNVTVDGVTWFKEDSYKILLIINYMKYLQKLQKSSQ